MICGDSFSPFLILFNCLQQHEQERGTKMLGTSLASGAGVMISRADGSLASGEDALPPDESAAVSVSSLWAGSGDSSLHAHGMQTFAGTGMGGPTPSAFDGSMSGATANVMSLVGPAGVGRGGTGGRGAGGLHAPVQKRTGGGIQVGDHTGYLRMRGLPFAANKEEIFKFFIGYNPVPDSVVLTYRNDGRATGEAYVAFVSPDDSKRAMELHRRMMGNRYIELFISNKDEHGRALARFGSRVS